MSHLRLSDRRVVVGEANHASKQGETPWAALRAAHESSLLEPLGSVMVRLYNQARTYFQNK